jgi:hypothetical protein
VRIYYICECCDKIIKCLDGNSTLPYEQELTIDSIEGDFADNDITCIKSLCDSCSEELRVESAYRYIGEIRYH